MNNTVSSNEGVAETFKKAHENKIVIESSKNQIKEKSRKSASAFRTISEVAKDIHVQQHVLRFWETKFSQIRPLKRGGGRRFYRPEDVLIIRKIHNLLYTHGYTIKGVQKLLKGQSKTQIIKEGFGEKKEITPSNDDSIIVTPKPEIKIEKVIEKVIVKEIVEVEIEKRSLSENQKSSLLNVLNDLKSLRNELIGKTNPIFQDS